MPGTPFKKNLLLHTSGHPNETIAHVIVPDDFFIAGYRSSRLLIGPLGKVYTARDVLMFCKVDAEGFKLDLG